jgi:Beta/Gamma crystallin
MTRYLLFIILSACFIFLPSSGWARSDDRADRVCIYKHDNFHGHEQCYRPGDEVTDLKHADISSIRVYGHAHALLYEDRDFRGRMMEFTTDLRDLKRVWHDHVGSLRVTDYAYNREGIYNSGTDYRRYKPYPLIDVIDEGVCVYEKPGYEGRYQCWAAGTDISNLSLSDWDDKISSVRVFGNGRLVAFRDKDFRGNQIVINRDSPDLALFPIGTSGNWNQEISSVEIR